MVYNIEHYLLKQKYMTEQAQHTDPSTELLHQSTIDPDYYLETVITLYRNRETDYRGNRNPDQRFIAEYAGEEADEYFDATQLAVSGLVKMFGGKNVRHSVPDEQEQKTITLGNIRDGASLFEMRNAWRQLWVAVNVGTNRLKRDSEEFQSRDLPEIFEMDTESKKALIDTLFANFQDLNALRFGAAGSGVKRQRWVRDPDTGRPGKIFVDPDLATGPKQIAENAANRRYAVKRKKDAEKTAVHPAGKMTPEEFKELRKNNSEIPMDHFAKDAAFLRNMAEYYAEDDE